MHSLSFESMTQTMRSFQASRVLLTAVELDIFTTIGTGATGEEVASRAGTDARATGTLLNALVSLGALTKNGAVFHNTAVAARHLAAGSPEDARPALMHTVHMWSSWNALTDCVRTGTAAGAAGAGRGDEGWTKAFIAAMHRNAQTTAQQVVRVVGADGVGRLLDIGGGSGAYSIAFARTNPNLVADILDLKAVLPIAQEHIAAAGLADRIHTRAGDLRKDEFGAGYDLVLLSAICHMLGPGENQDLLQRCAGALKPGGRIVIREFILDPDKTGPAISTLFAINMLVATESGSTYTLGEYSEWLEEAGFRDVQRPDPAGDLIVATRA